jgi:hypothetical protein
MVVCVDALVVDSVEITTFVVLVGFWTFGIPNQECNSKNKQSYK